MAGARGECTQAARLYGTAHALLEAVGEPMFAHVSDRARREHTLADLRTHLGEAAFAAAWAQGRAMNVEQALATPA